MLKLNRFLRGAAIFSACALAATACTSSKSPTTTSSARAHNVDITVWEGYTDTEGKVFQSLVTAFNNSHPGIHVSTLETSNDFMLQKVLTAARGGLRLTLRIYMEAGHRHRQDSVSRRLDFNRAFPRDELGRFQAGRNRSAAVNGGVTGIPALVDNLAIVYNKKLFAQLGLATPGERSWW